MPVKRPVKRVKSESQRPAEGMGGLAKGLAISKRFRRTVYRVPQMPRAPRSQRAPQHGDVC